MKDLAKSSGVQFLNNSKKSRLKAYQKVKSRLVKKARKPSTEIKIKKAKSSARMRTVTGIQDLRSKSRTKRSHFSLKREMSGVRKSRNQSNRSKKTIRKRTPIRKINLAPFLKETSNLIDSAQTTDNVWFSLSINDLKPLSKYLTKPDPSLLQEFPSTSTNEGSSLDYKSPDTKLSNLKQFSFS